MSDPKHDVILLEGIRIPCALGVSAEERAMRRPVRIDLEVEMDLRGSGASDDLEDTIDYQQIYDAAAAVVARQEHELVESLGQRIILALLDGFPPIQAVEVTVRKASPVSGVLDWAGVRLRRTRADLPGDASA